MMLTALILMGNPSCELQKEAEQPDVAFNKTTCGRYKSVRCHLTWRMLTTFLARNGPGLEACDMPTPV